MLLSETTVFTPSSIYVIFYIVIKLYLFNSRGISLPLALVVMLTIIVGGFFYPVIGMIVPVIIFYAAIASRFKPKAFCTYACPRNRILTASKPFSRYKPVPESLRSKSLRQGLCGFMMLCSLVQIAGAELSVPGLRAVGLFFWGICSLTLAVSLIMAVLYKPRSWCVVCPMGTLQQTVSPKK